MKTKLVVGASILAIRFDEKSFFSTILGFNHGWGFEHYNEHFSQKIVDLSTTNNINLKCDVIDGSVLNGILEPIPFSFFLTSQQDIKFFAPLKLFIIKKINKYVLNTITFSLEDDNNKKVDFNQDTLRITLQLIKI